MKIYSKFFDLSNFWTISSQVAWPFFFILFIYLLVQKKKHQNRAVYDVSLHVGVPGRTFRADVCEIADTCEQLSVPPQVSSGSSKTNYPVWL